MIEKSENYAYFMIAITWCSRKSKALDMIKRTVEVKDQGSTGDLLRW